MHSVGLSISVDQRTQASPINETDDSFHILILHLNVSRFFSSLADSILFFV
jgi:hypothetical protein